MGNYSAVRVWESDRNLLTSLETKWSTTSAAKYAYAYDDLGRRTDVTQSGSIFTRYGGDLVRSWGYSERSELVSEASTVGGAAVNGRGYAYVYDAAGNRTSASVDGLTPSDYPAANSLNQYGSRNVPGKIHVSGFAAAAASVIVRKGADAPVLATRAGDYYHGVVDSPNTVTANYDTVTATAAVTSPGEEYSRLSSDEYVAKSPEAFAHDADGNLTSDGLWRYEYNAENRLVKMIMRSTGETPARPSGTPAMDRKRLEFTYDYLGRRVEKKVYTGMDEISDTSGSLATHLKFVYDGFNLIGELDGATNTVNRTFMWGLDESGTTQGAGGVGGLLMIIDGSSKYLTAYDGSGNLTALLNEADGAVEAAYEYGPFGEPLQVEGTYADANPFRFSTKYTDSESGLVYFGLRYYNPTTGRFINRDPIGEAGGLNLYGFVGNDPINNVDFLGLTAADRGGASYFAISIQGVSNHRIIRRIMQRTFFAGLRRFLGLLGAGQLGEDNMRGLADWDNISSQERFNIQLDIADASGLDGPQFSTELIFFFYNQLGDRVDQREERRRARCDELYRRAKEAEGLLEPIDNAIITRERALATIDVDFGKVIKDVAQNTAEDIATLGVGPLMRIILESDDGSLSGVIGSEAGKITLGELMEKAGTEDITVDTGPLILGKQVIKVTTVLSVISGLVDLAPGIISETGDVFTKSGIKDELRILKSQRKVLRGRLENITDLMGEADCF